MTDLRFAMSLLSPDRRGIVRAIVLGCITLGAALSLTAVSAWLITRSWQRPPVLDLSVAVVTVRALGIGRGVSRYVDRLASHDLALRGAARAREEIYTRLADRGGAAALRSGELLLRTGRDVDLVADTLVRVVVPAGVAVVLGALSVVGLALLSPPAALVMLVFLVLSGAVVPLLAVRRAVRAEDAVAAAVSEQAEAAVLVVDHAEELAVAGRAEVGPDAVRRAGRMRRLAERRVDAAHSWSQAAVPAGMLGTALTALVVGLLVYPGGDEAPMWLGMLVLVPLAAFEANGAMPAAGEHLARALPAARRIRRLLQGARPPFATGRAVDLTEAAIPADPGDDTAERAVSPGRTVLRTRGLWWGPQGQPERGPLDLDLRPGDRMVVRGPSGSGKTTLAQVLCGALAPAAGEVVRSAPVVWIPEDSHVFITSIRDNLLVARGDADDEELWRVLDAVGLAAWVRGLGQGLDTVAVGGAAAMSGGQRRRLILARALLTRAEVVVLDEPTEHLDADSASPILQRICASGAQGLFAPEQALVVVTHDRSTPLRVTREIEIG